MDNLESVSNGSNDSRFCTVYDLQYASYASFGGILLFALVILIYLCFLQGRSRPLKSNSCRLPGLAAPISFLVAPRFRFIYIIIFGVMSTQALYIFNTLDVLPIDNVFLYLFYKILVVPACIVFALSLLYYPLFACVMTKSPLLGHLIGLFYSAVWFFQYVLAGLVGEYYPVICNPEENPFDARLLAVTVLSNVPVLLGSFYIMIWYFNQCIADCVTIKRTKSAKQHEVHEDTFRESITGVRNYQIKHVKSLLKKPKPKPPPRNVFESMLWKIKRELFPYNREFRFPVAFAGAVMAMSLLLYQLSFIISSLGFIYVSDVAVGYLTYIEPILTDAIETVNSTTARSVLVITVDILSGVFVGIPIIIVAAPFVSLILCGCLLFHMVASVSKKIKEIAKRGFNEKLSSPFSRVPSAWKYIGYQIGFFVLAWIIYALLVVLIGLVIVVIVILLKDFTEPTILVLLYLVVPLIWAKAFFYLQNVICHFVFLSAKGKFIAITNRGLFNWFAYVLFFYNGFAGFIGAVFRAFLASLFSLLLLFRLDTVVLMRGFEFLDYGHNSYLGFLYLDYAYNNAIIHVFISMLVCPSAYGADTLRSPSSTQHCGISTEREDDSTVIVGSQQALKSRRNRNRWLVSYTLLKNPSLRKLRAKYLLEQASLDTKSENELSNTADEDGETLNNQAAVHVSTDGSLSDSLDGQRTLGSDSSGVRSDVCVELTEISSHPNDI